MIIKNTFPDIYFCQQLVSNNVIINSNIPKIISFSLPTLSSPSAAPLSLDAAKSAFLHSFTDTFGNSTQPIQND
jgi:hypothetical protein